MTNNFYFKPTESDLSREQVIKQVGVDPDQTDKEILSSYGLFPIQESTESGNALDNPHPVYVDMGTYYLKCPSPDDIDLGEGKFIARELLCKRANFSLENLSRELGLDIFIASALPLISGSETSSLVKEFRDRQLEIISDLDKNLLKVEEAKKIEDLRQILKP